MSSLLAGSIVVELILASLIFSRGISIPAGHILICSIFAAVGIWILAQLIDAGRFIGVSSDIILNIGATLFYFCTYAACVVVLAYTLKLSYVCASVLGTLGYCCQHFWSDVAALLLGPYVESSLAALPFYLIHMGILMLGFLLTYLLFGRHFALDEAVAQRKVTWVVLSILVTFFVIVFSMVFADTQTGMARNACYIYDALATALLAISLISEMRIDRLRSDLTVQEVMWSQKRRQYEMSKESIELINEKCHDLRKFISKMGDEVPVLSASTIKKMKDGITVYDSGFHTGSDALDVVLTEKGLICSQRGIEFDCMADGSALDFMTDDDVYFLFENALNNAVEAALALDDAERRAISLTVQRDGGFAVIREDNYFAGKLVFSDGLPQTTKDDEKNHGFGTRSMRRLVEKHGGQIDMSAEDGVFSLSILLPVPEDAD